MFEFFNFKSWEVSCMCLFPTLDYNFWFVRWWVFFGLWQGLDTFYIKWAERKVCSGPSTLHFWSNLAGWKEKGEQMGPINFPDIIHLFLKSTILKSQCPVIHSSNFIDSLLSTILSIQNKWCLSLLVSSVL